MRGGGDLQYAICIQRSLKSYCAVNMPYIGRYIWQPNMTPFSKTVLTKTLHSDGRLLEELKNVKLRRI